MGHYLNYYFFIFNHNPFGLSVLLFSGLPKKKRKIKMSLNAISHDLLFFSFRIYILLGKLWLVLNKHLLAHKTVSLTNHFYHKLEYQ